MLPLYTVAVACILPLDWREIHVHPPLTSYCSSDLGVRRRGASEAAEGLERLKKGPEYEVKCSAGGAGCGSVPRSQSVMEEAEHASVMEAPDVLPQVV